MGEDTAPETLSDSRPIDRFATDADLHDALEMETFASREELDLRRELKFIKERAGWSADGIPLNVGRTAQLAAEDYGWNTLTGGSSQYDAYTNRSYMNSYLSFKYNSDPIARNIISAYTFYTFGGGFQVSQPDERSQDEFDSWSDDHNFVNFQRKIIQEKYLFGNAPVLLYPLTWPEGLTKKPSGESPQVRPTGAKDFRYIPDARINGIVRDAGDYTKIDCFNIDGIGLVAPCDVIQFTVEPLGTAVRGCSILTPVLADLVMLNKFAESRFYLNLTRSRLPVIRRTLSQTAGARNQAALSSLPKPGSILRIGTGEEIEFPSLNVDAGNAYDDYRLIMLRVASGVSLPEYLVSQDASNSNYSSTLIAESPAHNLFRSFQRVFSRNLDLLLANLGWDRSTIEPPSVVPRDFKGEADGLQIAIANGLCSTQTASERLGFDWETELERMDSPQVVEPFPLEDEPEVPTSPPGPKDTYKT